MANGQEPEETLSEWLQRTGDINRLPSVGSPIAPTDELRDIVGDNPGPGFWGYVSDAALGVVRGAAGAVEGIGELPGDLFGWDYDIPDNLGIIGESETWAGDTTDAITNFILGWGAIGKVGKVAKAARGVKAGKAAKAAATTKLGKVGKGVAKGAITAGSATLKGALTDAAFFTGTSSRLADLIAAHTELESPIIEFLKSDVNDSRLDNRLKNAIEGSVLGLPFEVAPKVIAGLWGLRKGNKVLKETGDPAKARKAAEEAADEKFMELEQQDFESPFDLEEAPVKTDVELADTAEMSMAELRQVIKDEGLDVANIPGDGRSKAGLREKIRVAREEKKGLKDLEEPTVDLEEPLVDPEAVSGATPQAPVRAARAVPQAEQAVEKTKLEAAWENAGESEQKSFVESWDSQSADTEVEFFDQRAYDVGLIWAYHGDRANPRRLSLDADVGDIITDTSRSIEKADGMGQSTTKAQDEAAIQQTAEFYASIIGNFNTENLMKALRGTTDKLRNVRTQVMAIRNVTSMQATDLKDRLMEIRKLRDKGLPIPREMMIDAMASQKRLGLLLQAVADNNGNFGRGLQSLKDIPDAGQFKKGLAHSDKDLKVLDKKLTKDPKYFDKWLDQQVTAFEAGDLAAMRISQANARRKGWVILNDVFYNSLLSGPRTQSVNVLGNLLSVIYRPAERAVGRSLTPGTKGFSELKMLARQVMEIRQALKMAGVAFRTGSGQLDPSGVPKFVEGARGGVESLDGDFIGRTDVVAGTKLENTQTGALINTLYHYGVKSATSALGAQDEFFKQIVYRAKVHTDLFEEAARRFPDLPAHEQAEWVMRQFEMMTEDGKFFSEKRALEKAFRDAKIELGDKATKDRIRRRGNELFEERWDEKLGEIAEGARDLGREVTFTTRNSAENAANIVSQVVQHSSESLQRLTSEWPVLRLVVPFINTPTNLLTFYLDRQLSPIFDGYKFVKLGAQRFLPDTVKESKLVKKLWSGLEEEIFESAEAQAEAMGRLVTSSSITTVGVIAAMEGRITGSGPKDPGMRKLWLDAGNQPYSFKMDDGSFVSYARLDPWASFLGIVADTTSIMQNTHGELSDDEYNAAVDILAASSLAAFNNIAEKSYLQGLTRLGAALSGNSYEQQRFWRNMGSMGIPGVLATAAKVEDPVYREIRSATDVLMSRVPGLSDELPPRRNMLGEPLERPGQWGEGFIEYISPFAYSQVNDDPLKQELLRLNHGFSPPRSIKNGAIDLRTFKNARGQSAYDRWQELHGKITISGRTLEKALKDKIGSSGYRRMLDTDYSGESPKVDELKKIFRKYRSLAYKQVLREYPELKDAETQLVEQAEAARYGREITDILNY